LDIFVFEDMKKVGVFQRRLKHWNDQLSFSIEEIKESFNPYKDRNSEQFFLDFAFAKHQEDDIWDLYNGEPFSYKVSNTDINLLVDFVGLFKNANIIPILFYYYSFEDANSGYFGGKSCGCYLFSGEVKFEEAQDTHEKYLKIVPYIILNEEAIENPSKRGQPVLQYFNDYKGVIPLVDLGICDYEF
jgi:hypothetical protein